MKSQGNLLAFLAAWFASIGAAFLLLNLEALAALQDCSYCTLCAQYKFAGFFFEGEFQLGHGYYDAMTGNPVDQALLCGGCEDTSCWCWQSQGCNTTGCNLVQTTKQINYRTYSNVNWTCVVPEGSSICVQGNRSAGFVICLSCQPLRFLEYGHGSVLLSWLSAA